MKFPYHVFKKTKKNKAGKSFKRYYYWFYSENGKRIQKACPNCRNRAEAENFIRTLPLPDAPGASNPDLLLGEIAKTMYLPGSSHYERRRQLGKSTEIETMIESRRYIDEIIKTWGPCVLREIEPDDVVNHLLTTNRSGSWKNRYISILKEIYAEAPRYKCKVTKPDFPTFARNSKKADIFSAAELKAFFQPENFVDYQFYLFFLLSLSGGLRLGETRAVRQKQIITEKKVLIVDGFCKRDGSRTVYNKKGTPDNPKFRIVPLPDLTVNLLCQFIAGRGFNPDDFIFTENGKPIAKERAERVFNTALLSAGLVQTPTVTKRNNEYKKQTRAKLKLPDGRKLVPHSLRYTYVSRMRRELTAKELQPLTGHASEAQVDYYNRRRLDEAIYNLPDADSALAGLLSFKAENA